MKDVTVTIEGQIPAGLAVVSFSNELMFAFPSPSLTSVNQPIQQVGMETVRLPLKQIESGDEVAD